MKIAALISAMLKYYNSGFTENMHIWSTPVFCWTVLWDTSIPCTCRWLKATLVVSTALYWWKVVSAALWQLQYIWHPDFEVLDLGLVCEVTHQLRACLSSLSCKLVSTPYLVSSKSSSIEWLFIQEYVNVGLKFKC